MWEYRWSLWAGLRAALEPLDWPTVNRLLSPRWLAAPGLVAAEGTRQELLSTSSTGLQETGSARRSNFWLSFELHFVISVTFQNPGNHPVEFLFNLLLLLTFCYFCVLSANTWPRYYFLYLFSWPAPSGFWCYLWAQLAGRCVSYITLGGESNFRLMLILNFDCLIGRNVARLVIMTDLNWCISINRRPDLYKIRHRK